MENSTMNSSPVEGMCLDNSVEQPHPQPQQALQPRQQQGIDFRQALSILSERSGQSESHRHDGCDSCHGSQIPESAKFMGQTIDLLAPTKPTASGEESMVHDEAALHQERTERLEKIRQQLHTMTNTELLQAVRKGQEDRVTTYREYERGLQVVLQTGNLTSYPDTCSKVTATFAVLSETIKSIQEIFASPERHKKDWAQLIQQLQQYEKEKLHLTAAHHLERIRQRDQQLQTESDPRIERLLQEGVATLQTKIHQCVQQINDIMEDIQCAILEEED